MGTEQLKSISSISEENIFTQFPEGTEIERKGSVVYIYDSSRSRRWEIQDFVMDWEKVRHRRLDLMGQTSGGTWSHLLGVFEARNEETDDVLDSGIVIDVIKEDAQHNGFRSTISDQVIYSNGNNGKIRLGTMEGYYGHKEAIMQDLHNLHALAYKTSDLPQFIDVDGTIERLAQHFLEGRFEPPKFVIPQETFVELQ